MAESGPRTFEDERFGRVTVTPGRPLVVEGERIGRFLRGISTEHAEFVAPDVEGRSFVFPVALIGRRSNDERVKLADGRKVRLRHTGKDTARVEIDGVVVAELVGRGTLPIRDSKRADYDVTWTPHTDALAVGLTHLLASRNGAGAPSVWQELFSF